MKARRRTEGLRVDESIMTNIRSLMDKRRECWNRLKALPGRGSFPETLISIDEVGFPLGKSGNMSAAKHVAGVPRKHALIRGNKSVVKNTTMFVATDSEGTVYPATVIKESQAKKNKPLPHVLDPNDKDSSLVLYATRSFSSRPTFAAAFEHASTKVEEVCKRSNVILEMDGHCSHYSYGVITWCLNHNVPLILIPSHTSSFLQANDNGLFSAMKRYVENAKKKEAHVTLHRHISILDGALKWLRDNRHIVRRAHANVSEAFVCDPNHPQHAQFTAGDVMRNRRVEQNNTRVRKALELLQQHRGKQMGAVIASPGGGNTQRHADGTCESGDEEGEDAEDDDDDGDDDGTGAVTGLADSAVAAAVAEGDNLETKITSHLSVETFKKRLKAFSSRLIGMPARIGKPLQRAHTLEQDAERLAQGDNGNEAVQQIVNGATRLLQDMAEIWEGYVESKTWGWALSQALDGRTAHSKQNTGAAVELTQRDADEALGAQIRADVKRQYPTVSKTGNSSSGPDARWRRQVCSQPTSTTAAAAASSSTSSRPVTSRVPPAVLAASSRTTVTAAATSTTHSQTMQRKRKQPSRADCELDGHDGGHNDPDDDCLTQEHHLRKCI